MGSSAASEIGPRKRHKRYQPSGKKRLAPTSIRNTAFRHPTPPHGRLGSPMLARFADSLD